MKFSKIIDFFIFYKISTFKINSDLSFEDIVEFIANMFKICSCRIEIKKINIFAENNLKVKIDEEKELFAIYINLSKNNVIFNFEKEHRQNILNIFDCISIYKDVSFNIYSTENTEMYKCLIYKK